MKQSVLLLTAIACLVPAGLAADAKLADRLFKEFCLPYQSAEASDRAISKSGRFGARQVQQVGTGTYVSYAIPGVRGVISVTYNAAGSIQCAVGINNRGPVLYENGRVTR